MKARAKLWMLGIVVALLATTIAVLLVLHRDELNRRPAAVMSK